MIRIKLVSYQGKGDLRKILKFLKEGCIIIVDRDIRPKEQAELIRRSLGKFSRGSSGIEISSIPGSGIFGKGLTAVGPSSLVKSIRKKPGEFQLVMGRFK